MENLIPSLIVIAVCAVVIIAIFWFVNRNKVQQEQKIQEIASLRGWEYERIREPLAAGYRLRGTIDGIPWTLEGLTESNSREAGPGSSETSSSTRWISPAANPPGGMVVIGTRPPGSTTAAASMMGSTLVQAALRLMVGKDAFQISNLREVSAGSASFQQRYMVWAHSEADAQRLLSSSVESALLAWPVKLPLVVKLGPQGLEIRLAQRKVTSSIEMDGMVNLGRSLLDAWQSPK